MTCNSDAKKIAEEAMGNADNSKSYDKSLLATTCMLDIEMKRIKWLWTYRIALGKLTVFAGQPGLGKSQITAYITAISTTGNNWPDTENNNPAGNVIILSAEDDPADTIKPRLIAAGADTSKCHVVTAVKTQKELGAEECRTFNLAEDVQRLEAAIERIGNVILIIIDPISAYLGDKDSNNNSVVRGLLMPLSEMAMRHNVAIILVTHFNKSTTQEPIERIIGSIGLVAAARAGYAVIKDETIPGLRYFLPIKNNIGIDSTGFAYDIQGVTIEQEIETSKINWHPGLVNASDVFNPEKKTQTNGAKEFLETLLFGGSKLVNTVFEEAEAMGYSKSCIQRAATSLGVKRDKLGMVGGWQWSL